jgi:hypothetical protein
MSENTQRTHIVSYIYNDGIATLIREVVNSKFVGYTILSKATAQEAIKHIPHADIVISDVSYGGYDVYNAAREHNKQIIILDGGLLDEILVPEAVVVQKPFNLYTIEHAIRRCAEDLKPDKEQ